MQFTEVIARLETALKGPLPGTAAQLLMAPRPRGNWPAGFHADRIRHAAALLLVFPAGNRTRIVLTVRADTLDRHSGQVSLPGGVIEPGETFEQAALREAHEEVGLAIEDVRALGGLTSLDIPVSGFRLHPIVAAARTRPLLVPSDGEVARIIEPAIDDLMRPSSRVSRSMTRGGQRIDFPAFLADDVEVWGATAMVLAEFLVLLGWEGPIAIFTG